MSLRNKPRLAAVNILCPICGDGEQCNGWKEIRSTVAMLNKHFREKHMTPEGVIIPNVEKGSE